MHRGTQHHIGVCHPMSKKARVDESGLEESEEALLEKVI
jgi:hypothetical protein